MVSKYHFYLIPCALFCILSLRGQEETDVREKAQKLSQELTELHRIVTAFSPAEKINLRSAMINNQIALKKMGLTKWSKLAERLKKARDLYFDYANTREGSHDKNILNLFLKLLDSSNAFFVTVLVRNPTLGEENRANFSLINRLENLVTTSETLQEPLSSRTLEDIHQNLQLLAAHKGWFPRLDKQVAALLSALGWDR